MFRVLLLGDDGMNQQCGENHFKMYKKGKMWLCSSIATLLLLSTLDATASANTEQVDDQPANDQMETQADTPHSVVNVAAVNLQDHIPESSGIDQASDLPTSATSDANQDSNATDLTSDSTTQTNNPTDQISPVTDQKQGVPAATPDQGPVIPLDAYSQSSQSDSGNHVVVNHDIDLHNLQPVDQAALNKIDYNNAAPAGSRWTYHDFRGVADSLVDRDQRYAVPVFDAGKIENLPAAYARDAQTGQYEHLDIWDSWPVQNPQTSEVVNWHGYQLVMAMMGVPNQNDNHVYLLYNRYNDSDLSHWQNAGPIFGYNASPLSQEWSGSAIVNPDDSIQMFYTQVDTSDDNSNHQKLATAMVNLSEQDGNVVINNVENNRVLFEGDGHYYQSYPQWRATNQGADNIALRDSHVVDDADGSRYLVFEGATGSQNYQGEHQVYNWKNYGGSDHQNYQDFFTILHNQDIKSRASWANAAIGILRLSDQGKTPTVAQLYTPLITANMVSDEIERPDVVKIGGKFYLFADTRLNRGSNDYAWQKANRVIGDNVAMIGYVSDHLTDGYQPLNSTGVVLTSSVPINWRTATYSYYALPVAGHDDCVLITAYMTNRNYVAGPGMNSTWAPSFLVRLNPDNTTTVLSHSTKQGNWIWNADSQDDSLLVSNNIDFPTISEDGAMGYEF